MHKERRDRRQKRLDKEQHYEDLEETPVQDKARERFNRKPYAMQSQGVADYMAKKYDIKRELEQ